MSAAPVFFVTPRVTGINSSGATNAVKTLAGADNTVVAATGGANGSVIQRCTVVQNAVGAQTINNIARFYIYDATSYYLVHEVNLGAVVTSSSTAIGVKIEVPELVGRRLPAATYQLKVGFSIAGAGDSFTITTELTDL